CSTPTTASARTRHGRSGTSGSSGRSTGSTTTRTGATGSSNSEGTCRARMRPVEDIMGNDDVAVGRILTRREILALFGAAGLTALTPSGGAIQAASVAGCIVRPEMIEGPYFVDERLERSDIRPEPATGDVPPGLPLTIGFLVTRLDGGTCAPLHGATVDL